MIKRTIITICLLVCLTLLGCSSANENEEKTGQVETASDLQTEKTAEMQQDITVTEPQQDITVYDPETVVQRGFTVEWGTYSFFAPEGYLFVEQMEQNGSSTYAAMIDLRNSEFYDDARYFKPDQEELRRNVRAGFGYDRYDETVDIMSLFIRNGETVDRPYSALIIQAATEEEIQSVVEDAFSEANSKQFELHWKGVWKGVEYSDVLSRPCFVMGVQLQSQWFILRGVNMAPSDACVYGFFSAG